MSNLRYVTEPLLSSSRDASPSPSRELLLLLRCTEMQGATLKGLVFRLIPPRPDFALSMSDEQRATMFEHVAYWSGPTEQGAVLAFGPVDDVSGPYGIGIVLTEDLEAAKALRDGDPALASPHGFRSEISPMPRLVTRTALFDGM